MAPVALATKELPEHVSHAGYRVVIAPSPKRIRAVFNGEVVADSTRALVMQETRLPWVYYFAREDVRMDLLARTDHRTNCPFKGNASYWTLTVADRSAANAVWSYEGAFDEASRVKDYVAFDWNSLATRGTPTTTRWPTNRAIGSRRKTTPWSSGSFGTPGRRVPRQIWSPGSPTHWWPPDSRCGGCGSSFGP